jgi:hypothetical protein
MASLAETYRLRYDDPEMKNRVTAAMAQNAGNIRNEDPTTPERQQWADYAFANTQSLAEQAMWDVVMNPTINNAGDTATDQDILFVVSSWINMIIPPPPPA